MSTDTETAWQKYTREKYEAAERKFVTVYTEIQAEQAEPVPVNVDGDGPDTGLPAGLVFLASGAALLALVIVTLWVLWGVIR
jgi:hypothetical protein